MGCSVRREAPCLPQLLLGDKGNGEIVRTWVFACVSSGSKFFQVSVEDVPPVPACHTWRLTGREEVLDLEKL